MNVHDALRSDSVSPLDVGKQIKKKGTEDNPAVTVSRPEGGNPVVKKASEIHVFEDGEEVPKNEKVSTAASESKK